ncbi:hypothetical protein TWF970_008848 [Orbilia oligospora]|uniref:Nucleoside phosphorylase domain-containing protein n=1 Tax=Orbilia oligospora TaxID=2813651 RepID=A0A7C8VFE8_ORBOL|nr:hypothetical protein TWF970_008848 [Orbilia oligospora]
MATRSRDAKDYTVGWLCALPIELAAARLCLDENHGDLVYDPNDCTHYTLGNIGAHNVVIGCLSAGQIGTNSAATIAAKMNAKFRNLRFGLMVGIGGGVPGQSSGGSRDYDFGKSASDGFVNTGFLNAPPQILLQALTKVQARHLGGETATLATHLAAIEQQRNFRRPSAADVLFKATYEHEELKSLVDPARRDAVTVDQFIPCLSPVNRFALTQSPGDCNADESSKFYWVFKNMDYEAWDTANQSAVLLLSGPTVCDIRQVSFSIIQREIEMARAGGSFVLYFLWTPEIAESPVAIHTLLNQLLRQLPPDEQTSCVRHFLNRLLEHRFKLRETPGWGKSFKRDEPLQTKIGHILDTPVEELWSALTVPLISENSKSKRWENSVFPAILRK